ncbi:MULTISPECIES: YjhX family toxin [Aminobacter]|jgi:uncharacterized protein YjhX (UPF0386 family)|uniref:Uncharacterized protein n=2 Tax=Phyllobacteriaceae TaxID=69277 RepID=A0ABR6C279_9HYPH|nr:MULTISPECIES: YjhX family toxin [Aminobacter]MBA9019082.1 hypothetical protein [Aminobacter ciceronei]MRX32596.1 hypothetical protein [Aminobacter sp. MDW-2]
MTPGALALGLRTHNFMNISKKERKALEVLSFGGTIILEKDTRNRPLEASFVTREGWSLEGAGLAEFKVLKAKRLVVSRNGGNYTISREGVVSLQQARQAAKKG